MTGHARLDRASMPPSAGVHRLQGLETLDLDRVAEGVQKEHGPLLAWLSGKTQVRLDHKFDPGCREAVGHGLPVGTAGAFLMTVNQAAQAGYRKGMDEVAEAVDELRPMLNYSERHDRAVQKLNRLMKPIQEQGAA